MTKTPWILFAIAASAVLLPVACGGGSSSSSSSTSTTTTGSSTTGTGGSGGTATTTTTTSTTTGTASGGGGSGSGGGPVDCTGILMGDCGTCAEANCCTELGTCNNIDGCIDCLGDNTLCTADNQDAAQAVLDCAMTSCNMECFPPPPPPPDATCSVPPGAKGACAVLSADIKCNPITNEPCNTAAGEACDTNGTGFECYPAPNDKDLCQTCGSADGFCKGGQTCIGVCARYCCDDTECGVGKCDKALAGFPSGIGVCLGNGAGGGGAGGAGGGAP